MKDYYKILELEKTATQEEIKKSFRRLSKVLHPDKATGNAEKFKELNEAYQTLSDKNKRYAYDHGTTYSKPTPPIVNDIILRIKWTLDDIKRGKTIKVPIERVIVCKACNGVGSKEASSITICPTCNGAGRFSKQELTPFGYIMMEHTCTECKGSGEFNSAPCPNCKGQKMVNDHAQETVIIPPNIITAYTKVGAGHKTIHGDSNLVILLTLDDQGVTSSRDCLFKTIEVSTFDALLGKEQIVTIKDKTLKVVIPKDSKHGQSFRLKQAYCGIDLIVEIVVYPPTLKQTKEFVLDIFKDQKDILPTVTAHVNNLFK